MSDSLPASTYNCVPYRQAGNIVFISGQVGMEDDGTFDSDPERQFRTAFSKLGKVLESAGLKPENIVEITSYHTDLHKHFNLFSIVKHEFLGSVDTAWTAIGVSQVADRQGALVEVKVTAAIA